MTGEDVSMKLLDGKLGIANITKIHDKSEGSSLSIKELLPSMDRSVVCCQKSPDFLLELSSVAAKEVSNVGDDLVIPSRNLLFGLRHNTSGRSREAGSVLVSDLLLDLPSLKPRSLSNFS